MSLAAHPDFSLYDYLDVLEATIKSGYRHRGFPEADVEVALSNTRKRIEVGVREGKRYRCGSVQVTGAKHISAETLIRSLSDDSKPQLDVWKKGEPAQFDDEVQSRIRERLKTGFAAAGFFYPDFEIGINRDPSAGTAGLVVTIKDDGPRFTP